MNERSNIVTASLARGRTTATTRRLWQHDYGMKLRLEDIDLPELYEVHFSDSLSGSALTVLGSAEGVSIPDRLLTTGRELHAWLYLHTEEDDGETVYHIIIPVFPRPAPDGGAPTPVEQNAVTQALAALNTGISRAVDAAEDAEEASLAVQSLAVDARTLAAGSQATVEKTVAADGAVTLHFGIPTGPQGPQGETGEVTQAAVEAALGAGMREKLLRLPAPAAGNGRYVIQQSEQQMALVRETALPSSGSIALSAAWSGNGPYTQTVTVTGAAVTQHSKVDLQPTAAQLAALLADGVTALVIENNAGTLTAYALGAAASASMTVQCTVTEVEA